MARILKFVLFVAIFLTFSIVSAQTLSQIPLKCGDILEAELDSDNIGIEYILEMSAGTNINLVVEPLGDGFNPFLVLLDSGRGRIFQHNFTVAGENEELLDYTVSSSNSILQIFGTEPRSTASWNDIPNNMVGTYFGAFLISVDCTLRDGTRIPAGSTIPDQDLPVRQQIPDSGFPGLPPVDFANGITIPLLKGSPNSGAINPGFESVFGYTFDGVAGDTVSLSFQRLQGNANLGLAVLSQNNEIAFMAALVSSYNLSTTFILPSDGQYTIGVFRIDLISVPSPEATSFSITVD
ncbi:MAG: hypothetical protein H6670_05555 [Anaerolineaceae bacterium]|nr:hypothetical protein [Anaerolineaceae bacterium]